VVPEPGLVLPVPVPLLPLPLLPLPLLLVLLPLFAPVVSLEPLFLRLCLRLCVVELSVVVSVELLDPLLALWSVVDERSREPFRFLLVLDVPWSEPVPDWLDPVAELPDPWPLLWLFVDPA
jgi:hypothetical protein